MPRRRQRKLPMKNRPENEVVSSSSPSDLGSDAEDLPVTLKVREHDKSVLLEEEERVKLLRPDGPFKGLRTALGNHSRDRRRGKMGNGSTMRRKREQRRAARRQSDADLDDDGEMIFEMEEGFKDSISQSSSSTSLELDRRIWESRGKQPRKNLCRRFFLPFLGIIILFVLMSLGAYKASSEKSPANDPSTLSNGTHMFAPTTILISLDGFRADFLNRGLTPALASFIASGVSPRYMLPSFPSVTFPNHFTLVTGLYPESHGVVGNTFWDPELLEEFWYTDPARSMQPKWWTAEPLWVTAELQGVRSAIHMWPGSEAGIPPVQPTYLDKFNGSEALSQKMDRVLGLIDLPGDEDTGADSTQDRRPQFIAAYVPNVDADGHKYGPNSTEIRSTISDVDSMLAILMEGLYARNLTEIINIVVVSDHGMATTSTSRLIQLDEIVDISLVDHFDGWPLRGLRLKHPERDVPILYQQLLKESKKSGTFDVYTLDTMPERYHFSTNDRIAPLWIVPKTGWAIPLKENFDVAEAKTIAKVYRPMGLHGYDHEHPLMRAIFVARGPAFPHAPNSRVPPFQNIEVYNIVCDSLGIKPHPNNGTLRLPLKTEGLHSDPGAPALDNPNDPSPIDSEEPEADSSTGSSWWDVIHGQIEKAKEWAKGVIEALKHKAQKEEGGEGSAKG